MGDLLGSGSLEVGIKQIATPAIALPEGLAVPA
jgi:hypothetical protein